MMSAHQEATASAVVKTLSRNVQRAPAISGTVVWSETGNPNHGRRWSSCPTALPIGKRVG
jgi:hypothetical protein